jgi:hypothetical protein
MPLDAATLQTELETFFVDCAHADPALSAAECGARWADAVGAYAAGIVPPSTTVAAASSALSAALAGAFTSPSGAAPGFDAAFAAFAVTVAAGMLPTYTGVPPAVALGVAGQLASNIDTHAAAAASWALFLDAWFRTGSAALVAPPNTVVLWT